MLFTLPLLALAGTAQAAISVLYPRTDTFWFKNNTVALNWTSSDPTADTFFFRTILSNEDAGFYGSNQTIADQTNATATYVRVLLPGVPSGGGYIVSLVNMTNPAQTFARSEAFRIEDGAVATSTTPPTTQTSAPAASGGNLPNAQPSRNPFPSVSPSSAATALGAGAGAFSLPVMLAQAGIMLAALGVGAGVLL